MIREFIHDESILAVPCEDATKDDIETAKDLRDTLISNSQKCAGIAANMIGVTKRIIVVAVKPGDYLTMFNPKIVGHEGKYEVKEQCLSLEGDPKTAVRYKKITVEYRNSVFIRREKSFSGFTAEVIQHCIDHCDGILI